MRILLPVDGSEASLDAVRHALSLVEQGLQADFVLANVQEPATLYELMLTRDADVLEQQVRRMTLTPKATTAALGLGESRSAKVQAVPGKGSFIR